MEKELLYRFFKGETTPEENYAIKEWYEDSIENKKQFFHERKMFDAIILLSTKQKISAVQPRKRILRISYQLVRIACMLILTIGITLYFVSIEKEEIAAPLQAIHVPSGQRVNVVLPDGSNVWLNANTTIHYPSIFAKNQRVVRINGEGYFTVKENKEVPFIVETDKCKLEVLGTEFNVNAYSADKEMEVALMTGSVRVTSNTIDEKSIVLAPNQKLSLQQSGDFNLSTIDDDNIYKWIDGLICFQNQSFSQIMKTLEKYYNTQIVIENDALNQYHFTGKFRHVDGLEYVLKVLQRNINFKYENDTHDRIIYIK